MKEARSRGATNASVHRRLDSEARRLGAHPGGLSALQAALAKLRERIRDKRSCIAHGPILIIILLLILLLVC